MTTIILIVSSIVAILGGIYIALLGFRKVRPEKNKPEQRERMELWHKKYGGFAKYGGLFLILIGVFNFVINVVEFDTSDNNWTEKQKNSMTKQIIDSSSYLKSIDYELANTIAMCIVENYTAKYTSIEVKEHDKLPSQELDEIMNPLIHECINKYKDTRTE
jgi:hypothetical protein